MKANGANKKLKDSEDHKTNQKSSSTTSKQKISKASIFRLGRSLSPGYCMFVESVINLKWSEDA